MPEPDLGLPLDLRIIKVAADDNMLAFGTFDDHPGQIAFICEKEEEGLRKRRAIFFPNEPRLAANLAQALMEIAGVQGIQISAKKGTAHITFGPRSAGQVFDEVVRKKSDANRQARKKAKKKKKRA